MSPSRVALTILLSSTVAGCFQELDSGAADGVIDAPPVDPNAAPTTVIDTPGIGIDPDDEEAVTDDPCAKTSQDAHRILTTYCAMCHDQGPASQGVPRFDFLLDDQRLMSETWTVGDEARKFVIAGDPDDSWLYLRPLFGTMPPIPTYLRNAGAPRPTISDLSVLREWISSCIGPREEAPTDPARFNFETDTQGWIGLPDEPAFMNVYVSEAQSYSGNASLAGSITSTSAAEYFLEVENPTDVAPGGEITYHVLFPSGAPISAMSAYVTDANRVVTASSWTWPATGDWNTLRVAVPEDAAAIISIGIELRMDAPFEGTVYVDSIDW